MNEYDKIANLVISLTEIDIFENRRTQSHVDARAFFDFIMRKLKNKTYTGIAKYYHSKGKSADHSTILYRTNMFDEIKCRKPEYKTWLNIIKNEIISSKELLIVFDKIKVLKTPDSLEQVNELIDKLAYKEKLYNSLIDKN
tara:strand:- start:1368 stop:1790 length:423 start_codon:yes stop_codon:yes gene_type:complete